MFAVCDGRTGWVGELIFSPIRFGTLVVNRACAEVSEIRSAVGRATVAGTGVDAAARTVTSAAFRGTSGACGAGAGVDIGAGVGARTSTSRPVRARVSADRSSCGLIG